MERPSLAELFAANVRFVWRVLVTHGVREAEAEDATQEVFLTAHRRMEDWDPSQANARTWLYAISIRVAANFRKRVHNTREQSESGEGHASSAPEPEGAIDRERFLLRVERAIAALDAPKREVFSLFELEELSMKEIARIVECPLQTAYARLYAARREIAAAIGDEHGGIER
jgi:RNA polymerase sigma-70 factor, ECF subfamily